MFLHVNWTKVNIKYLNLIKLPLNDHQRVAEDQHFVLMAEIDLARRRTLSCFEAVGVGAVGFEGRLG